MKHLRQLEVTKSVLS